MCTSARRYVGYASPSNGDEGIGPHHGGDPDSYPHVLERLNKWAEVCANHTSKMLMGGISQRGIELGFGIRNGFVEHYWYARSRPSPPPSTHLASPLAFPSHPARGLDPFAPPAARPSGPDSHAPVSAIAQVHHSQ